MSTTTDTQLLAEEAWTGKIFSTGGWVGAPATAETIEPATGRVLGTVGVADAEVVAAAASDAARAQREWARLPFTERRDVMLRAAALFAEHGPEIRDWVVRESGAIPPKGDVEVGAAIGECHEAAALTSQASGVVLPSPEPGRTSSAARLPVGVVGVIAPWNFPLVLAMRSVAPALALGNAIVLKSDPNTPVCGGVVVAQIFAAAGLPDGLLHVFTGGADVGEAMTADPNIAMISFTGSTAVGRKVGEAAGRNLKRVALELGGNNPLIVLDDADLDAAASAGAWGSFLHQGQICMAAGRHIVHESLVEEYLVKLTERAARLTAGNPAVDEVALGPIINETQAASVQRIVDDSREAGATVTVGGERNGLFFPATVLRDVTAEMPAWRQEIFGPVAPVTAFSTDEQAVALANDTDLGLTAAIQSGSPERAWALGEQLHAGMVHVNDQTVNDWPSAPFSGVGSSGNGIAFGGPASIEAFTEWHWFTSRDRGVQYPF
ncbi:MAG TPA: aldehyde dehydrogenase family protein [Solirubrobacteraceae bacterium]|nr:aldehyde dehydrogenase family protein [Solirubrobacteraceae bacterium]